MEKASNANMSINDSANQSSPPAESESITTPEQVSDNEMNGNVTDTTETVALTAEIVEADQEKAADHLEQKFELTPVNRQKTAVTVFKFIRSYIHKPETQNNVEWLKDEFRQYPDLWSSPAELEADANAIVSSIEQNEKARQEFAQHRKNGRSRESWLAEKLETAATAHGVLNVGQYAGTIESALEEANRRNIEIMYRNDGQLNQQFHFDGFIAEQHHANTFNIEAASKGSEYRAEVLRPGPGDTYGKNSVDLVIRDGNGKIVRKYQSKYGQDADATQRLFDNGDYRGQRKLVPKGQSENVSGSSDRIEMDGISSKPLSKEEAKELQRQAQEKAIARQYEWNEVNRIAITKNIGKQAALAGLFSIGFQGARILGRRIWNSLTRQENQSVEEDVREFVSSSIQSAAGSGLLVAATGGITVAVKSGWLGKALRATPVGFLANAVCVGIENVKVMYQYGTGQLTGDEAIMKAGDATCSTVGSLLLGSQGAAVGAACGTILGPVGSVIGGIVGGIAGGIAGSTVGSAIFQRARKIGSAVSKVCRSIGSAVKSAGRKIASILGW